MKRGRFDHCRYIYYLFRWQDYNIDLSDSEGVQREGQAAVYKIPVKGPKVHNFKSDPFLRDPDIIFISLGSGSWL